MLYTEACTLAELFTLLGQKDYALGILPDHQEGKRGDEPETDLEHKLEAADIYTLAMVSIALVISYSDSSTASLCNDCIYLHSSPAVLSDKAQKHERGVHGR